MFEWLSEEARQRLKRLTLELAGDRAPALEALAHRSNGEFGVDPFGFDPDYELSAVAPFVSRRSSPGAGRSSARPRTAAGCSRWARR